MKAPIALLLPLAMVACSPGDEAANNDSLPNLSAGDLPLRAVLAATVSGFETPEAVQHDAEQDVYFISNINGGPSARDDNGYISRVHGDSLGFPLMRWVASGRNGVQLNAPKGMTIVGDTLWVADLDQLRAFNRHTGNPLGSVDLSAAGAVFLNDVAAGPDGALYVTDTGIHFDAAGNMTSPGPMRIFRIADRTPSVALEGDILANPNGIAWSPARSQFVIGSFGGADVLGWAPGTDAPTVIATGPGSYDGVVALSDGRVLITSWADSSLYLLPAAGSELRRVVAGVSGPAAIAWDESRQRVAIPLFSDNRVVMYDLARADSSDPRILP